MSGLKAPYPKPAYPKPRALRGFGNINRYWDKTNGLYAAKLLPGEYYVTCEDEVIVTVLGSCVSACIRDRKARVGGMNHFMLPAGNTLDNVYDKDYLSSSARYGNFAMEHLINSILKAGGSKQNLEVKIVGGGQIIANMTNIGKKNIEFVRHYLQTEGLRILAEDVGDVYPRKLQYFPRTGKVRVKKLQKMHNNTIIDREIQYKDQIEKKPVSGDIELF